jgi:hypothetical protein
MGTASSEDQDYKPLVDSMMKSDREAILFEIT